VLLPERQLLFVANSAAGCFVKAGESGLLFLLRGVENSGKNACRNALGIMERSHGPIELGKEELNAIGLRGWRGVTVLLSEWRCGMVFEDDWSTDKVSRTAAFLSLVNRSLTLALSRRCRSSQSHGLELEKLSCELSDFLE
jgi:hypothetical protein